MLTLPRLCTHIISLVHAPIRVYNTMGEPLAIFVDHGEQPDVLACDQDLLTALLKKSSAAHPVLHLEAKEIVYCIVSIDEKRYILGPCCLGQNPMLAAKHLIKQHKLNPKNTYRISRCSLIDFCEAVLLLYEYLTGTAMEISELLRRNFCDEQFEQKMHEKVHEVFSGFREISAIHNPYSQELREQESIRTGNLEALQRSFEESYVGKLGVLAPDPLRNAKNLAIVLITLASRSAIAGGILPEVAFSMSDAFIQRLEEMSNVAEATALGRQAEIEYCLAVKRLSSGGVRNTLVTKCKNLVIQQLYGKLSVKDLARQLDITPDHLSHLFIKEEGMKLTDYITQEKIALAKNHLVYTEDSYSTLAFSLGFSSQSHFGQIFKRWTGMTPKEYREYYGLQCERY